MLKLKVENEDRFSGHLFLASKREFLIFMEDIDAPDSEIFLLREVFESTCVPF